MKRVFYILAFFLLLASGCRTKKEIVYQKIIKEKIDTLIKEVPVHINVPVHLPGKTVFKTDTVIVYKDKPLNAGPLFAYGQFAWSKAGVKNSILYNNLYEKDTTFTQPVDTLLIVNEYMRTHSESIQEKETRIVIKDSKFGKFSIKWTIGSWILIVLIVLYKIYRPRLHI